ncbi:MAG: molybdopterin molybdotransferase MoeA [Acidimicrobiales bacterium]|jgi:molybdopterin molybdotransferase|nr:molybdopterin molybdotransferase MoeA [Acidimicrobiales bacterium]
MISLHEAQNFVLDSVKELSTETLGISSVSSTVIAESVFSHEFIPPFDNTAVDGYAVRARDTVGADKQNQIELMVIGSIAAGSQPDFELECGQSAKIMTGAPLPAGADAVVMVERTTTNDDGSVVFIDKAVHEGDHIRKAGEDLEPGDLVIEEGTYLAPAHIGLLASVGIYQIKTIRRPVIGVFSTGDELVQGSQTLQPGQIRDSNRFSLLALLERDGFPTVDLGLIPDNKEAIEKTVFEGLEESDALLTTGGVSMGDYDYVKVVLDEIGDMRWMQIAIKPAKPFAFGLVGGKPVFGLPGNPVSSMVSYLLLAKPALKKMMGCKELLPSHLLGQTADDFLRRSDGKTHFVRAMLQEGGEKALVSSIRKQGSHQLTGMAKADILAILPDGDGVTKGEPIEYFRF